MSTAKSFADIEAALAAGNLEMKRPWGDWVPVRRRAPVTKHPNGHRSLQVWMENDVEAAISTNSAAIGFPDVRIVG